MSTANLGRDLGPFQPTRKSQQQFAAYVKPVHDDPAGAVAKLKRLHRDTPIGVENMELYAWNDKMGCVVPGLVQVLGGYIWQKLIAADVISVYFDLIFREDFWPNHWYFCCPVIESLTGIIRYAVDAKDIKVGEALLARAPGLFRNIWEHRHQLKSLRTYLDREDNFAEPLVELITDYANLYDIHHHKAPPIETYMPHVAVHAWMIYDGNGPVNSVNNAYRCLIDENREVSGPFFEEVLLSQHSIGAEAYVLRVKREFQRTQTAAMLIQSTAFLLPVAHVLEPMRYFGKHGLMAEASRMLDRIREHPGTANEKTSAYTIVLGYLNSYTSIAHHILQGLSTGHPMSFRGEHLINILAYGVNLLSDDGRTDLEAGTDVVMCGKMVAFMSSWGSFYADCNNIKTDNPNAALARLFMVGMVDRARSDWWPSLNRLQIRQLRVGVGKTPELTSLKDGWIQFGKVLGLSAKKERARHEKEMRSHCAWRACKYHREKPSDVPLLACKGCGDVRYCGRECQKSDWSKGGHKAQCMRLK